MNTAGAFKIRSFGLERVNLVNHDATHIRMKVDREHRFETFEMMWMYLADELDGICS